MVFITCVWKLNLKFSIFNFQFSIRKPSACLVEMMGFGRNADCAFWSPSALTVHRTVIHCLLCSNPKDSLFQRLASFYSISHGGDDGIRTHDPLLAGQVLSQLSYTPIKWFVVSSPFFKSRSGLIHSVTCVGIELFSRTVSRKVSSPLQSLTSVFGMGTGGPSAFVTPTPQRP